MFDSFIHDQLIHSCFYVPSISTTHDMTVWMNTDWDLYQLNDCVFTHFVVCMVATVFICLVVSLYVRLFTLQVFRLRHSIMVEVTMPNIWHEIGPTMEGLVPNLFWNSLSFTRHLSSNSVIHTFMHITHLLYIDWLRYWLICMIAVHVLLLYSPNEIISFSHSFDTSVCDSLIHSSIHPFIHSFLLSFLHWAI